MLPDEEADPLEAQRRYSADRRQRPDLNSGAGPDPDLNEPGGVGARPKNEQPPGQEQTSGQALGETAGQLGTRALANSYTGGWWERARQLPGAQAATSKVEQVGGKAGKAVGWSVQKVLAVAAGALFLGVLALLAVLVPADGSAGFIHPSTAAHQALGGNADSGRFDRTALERYVTVGAEHDVPWTVLAALGAELTDHGATSPYDSCNRDPYRAASLLEAAGDASDSELEEAYSAGDADDSCQLSPADRVAWQGTTTPPIGGEGGQGSGPFLLTPAAVAEVGIDDAQHFERSLGYVAETLAGIAAALRREGMEYDPGDPERAAEADAFWTEAVSRLGTVVTDPEAETASCGDGLEFAFDNPTQTGAAISTLAYCELANADREQPLQLVEQVHTSSDGPTFEVTTGGTAIRTLTREILTLTYATTGWEDLDSCSGLESALVRTSAVQLADGTELTFDPCDPVENITAVARKVASYEQIRPDERDDNPFIAQAGAWWHLGAPLGDELRREVLAATGPVGIQEPSAACQANVNVALASLAASDDGDLFLGWETGTATQNPDLDDDRTAALDATLFGGPTALGLRTACVGDRPLDDGLYERHLRDLAIDLALRAAPYALERLDHADSAQPAPPDAGDGDAPVVERPEWLPDDLDDVERFTDALYGISQQLAVVAPQPSTPVYGQDPVFDRLAVTEHIPLNPPNVTVTDVGSSTTRLSFADRVIRQSVTYGGTVIDDERGGRHGATFTTANCSVDREFRDVTDPQTLAQLTWEIFYCEAALAGLEDTPATSTSAFNAARYGITNKAQQVAAEAVAVAWCESGYTERNVTGFSDDGTWRGDNGTNPSSNINSRHGLPSSISGYSGVFQMGPDEAATYIPGWEVPPHSEPWEDLRFNAAANITGAARYFLTQHDRNRWDGWGPWAVVNTDYGGPNVHVRIPILPRFPSTRDNYVGQHSENLPDWAINPFDEDLPDNPFAGCGQIYAGGSWEYAGTTPPIQLAGRVTTVGAGGVACPVPGSDAHHTDDWHFPRSGGRLHMGNDFFAPEGTPVYAPGDGVVDWIRRDSIRGRMPNPGIGLVLEDGSRWLFLHNRQGGTPDHLQVGTRVSAGEKIGEVGREGNAWGTPPHAHVELRPDGPGTQRVNPYPVLVDICPDARQW